MSALEILAVVLVMLITVINGALSYRAGLKRGKAIGWVERQEQIWADEKARRDALGRFRQRAKFRSNSQ